MTEQEKIELYVSYYGISLQEATEMRKREAEIEAEYLKFCPEGCDPVIGPAVEDGYKSAADNGQTEGRRRRRRRTARSCS